MTLIVGLGNPGREYRTTRHNTGFLVIDRFAQVHSFKLTKRKFYARIGIGTISGEKVILAKPLTFMNLSGESVAPLVSHFSLKDSELVVVHDDLDLSFGRIRIKVGGGDAGHQGLRSIIESLGTSDFVRIRVGIGRPPKGTTATEYVLHDFNPEERKEFGNIAVRASEALERILKYGVPRAMNEFNQ